MSKTYSKMPDEATERVAHLVKLFHSELHDVGVRFDLLSIASDSDNGKPALMHQGYAADAVVRATNVKERTKGAGDVEIVVDEERYLAMTDAEKDALLDHEIEHVELKHDKKTLLVKRDCRGRPKIGMKKHDQQFGWFQIIAERHGIASGEVKQATRLYLAGKQVYFAFALEESTRLALEEATAPQPSEKVREIAKEILSASPAVRKAATNLVENLRAHNVTMSVTHGDKTVEIK